MSRAKSDAYESVKAAVLALPGTTSKRMFGANAFFIRGRMFAFLLDDAIVLKLPEAERQSVIGSRIARPFLTGENAPFGRWVEVGIGGSDGPARAYRLAQSALELAQSPDREGPRKRRPAAKRRKAKQVSGEQE